MTQDQKEAKHTYWRGVMDKWSASLAADLKNETHHRTHPRERDEEEREK